MRTSLTTLSISIGIAAVMCVVAIGAGSSAQVQRQLDNLGEDFVWIEPGSHTVGGARSGWGGARTLVVDDATALEQQIADVAQCSPQVEGREQVIAGNQNWNTRYRGVSPNFFDIRKWSLVEGSFFADYDLVQGNRVTVLGDVVAERLFGQQQAVGQQVRIGRVPFRVIGVLYGKGASRGSVDRDDVMFVPHTTAKRYFNGKDWVDDIMCSVQSPELMDRAEFQITSLLRLRHGLEEGMDNDFSIRKPQEAIEMRAEATRAMTMMLTAIASVSLVVGGVGIMNIMLVSVTERTQEIGLRLAVGARMTDIRVQFLTEAATLGILGGVAGVAVGWVGSRVMASGFGWPVVVSPDAATIAVLAAMAASVVFGYYPAHQASALDPIDAIRVET